MKKRYFNYDKLLEEFLNRPILEQIKCFPSDLIYNTKLKNIIKDMEFEKMHNLMRSENYFDEKLLEESYLFGIIDNNLKIVQFSKNYLMDDLLIIEDFLKKYSEDFNKKLRKTYWVNQKIKEKYIKKAQRKNIETIYDNTSVGANILNYINEKEKYNLLGDRYGLQNYITENLEFENPNFMKSKMIIIINFDCEIIELYQSIPYELLQKGTANLESDSIYGCYFNDFDKNIFFEKIRNN